MICIHTPFSIKMMYENGIGLEERLVKNDNKQHVMRRITRQTIVGLGALFALLAISLAMALPAAARCDEGQLEQFLQDRVFTLSADRKIDLYDDEIIRYYDQRNRSRRQVLNAMRNWEARWPDRIYKFLRIHDFRETEEGDACRVSFDYKFLAYDPSRDKTSAGIGRTTFILADTGGDGAMRIIAEYGTVRCRGVSKFVRSRC